MHAIFYRKLILQKLCRFIDKIVLIRRQKRKIRFYRDLTGSIHRDLQPVKQMNGLHHHADLMITILSFSYHIQPKIDLSQRLY